MSISPRKSRTEQDALQELLAVYAEIGAFSTSQLMAINSGLERCIRVKFSGVRNFCMKHDVSYILTEPVKNTWSIDKAVEKLRELHDKVKKPVGINILNQEGYSGLYQWIRKNHSSYRSFCESYGLNEIIHYHSDWSDSKCFRLIKEEFIKSKACLTPEFIKKNFKGAYNYIIEQHGGFDAFIAAYDLQEYVHINIQKYDSDLICRLIKEAYVKNGNEKVYPNWLTKNGYSGLASHLMSKEGGFAAAVEALGLTEYATVSYTKWTDELALMEIRSMLEEKNEDFIIHEDFRKYGKTGVREWIKKTYIDIPSFFKKFNMEDQFKNMKDVGKELWNYGLRFQELCFEVLSLFFNDLKYNKWVEHGFIRPDFILGTSGTWIDAKLTDLSYYTDDTVEKYTTHKDCKELWIVYLRKQREKIEVVNPKVKLIHIDSWIPELERLKRFDLVMQIQKQREEIEHKYAVGNVETKTAYKKKQKNMENYVRKLNEDHVREIRLEYPLLIVQGMGIKAACRELGGRYGVTANNIRGIIKGETWKHV
ncbi:hypothetical protein J2T17_006392 [Paenibacillus mucilaginosus]